MPDYVPANDDQLKGWMTNFMVVLAANLVDLNLLPEDIAPLQEAQTSFGTALTVHQSKQAAARAATSDKNEMRIGMVSLLRTLVRDINNSKEMTPQIRSALGLPPRTTERAMLGAGEEIPDIYLDTRPGLVTVHFVTTPANEMTNGKPSWAKGCNVYRMKTGEAGFQMMAFCTASPFQDEVFGDASDYTYYVRYRGTKDSDLGSGSTQAKIAARGLAAA